MNKITKKLFLYFTVVALLLSGTVFLGFYGTFHSYSLKHHEAELHARAETISNRLESYFNSCTENQELAAYIKVLDDISLADAYFVTPNGTPLTCACECGSVVAIEKKPTEEVKVFADEIFKSGRYVQDEISKKTGTMIRVGIPVKEKDKVTAVVVIVDSFDLDQKSFFYAIIILLGCLIVSLVLSACIAYGLAKRFMNPIQKIAITTKILASGNYHIKTDVSEENEIGILAKEVDVLAEKLASMEQMQNDYITSVSHELRTPVTVIRSSLEALYDGIVPEEKKAEYYKQMLSETISLQRLVNDMLELSRLENEEFIIQKEQMNLLQAVEDAMRSIRLIAREKNIAINYDIVEDEWSIEGDYGRIRQMFIIALDNAVKYSEPDKKIWVEAKWKGNNYYISVRDEGCGIPKEKQDHIFSKFYHSSNENSTGMGLVVMKSIAKRHEIEVRLYSKENEGTKIVFIVPVYKNERKSNE